MQLFVFRSSCIPFSYENLKCVKEGYDIGIGLECKLSTKNLVKTAL